MQSYSDFKKCFKKEVGEEKYEENKVNVEGTYPGNGLADSAQIWNWRCPTTRKLTHKILCVSV